MQKAQWQSEEGLQKVEKRREAKGKGEKETYIHLNVEFQRIVRRSKKAFLSEQSKEIEETIEWETRNLFQKIRDTSRTLHVKMGTKKYGTSMGLTEAEDIKKRW